MTPQELLIQLIATYKSCTMSSAAEHADRLVLSIFELWVGAYWEDFKETNMLSGLEKCLKFTSKSASSKDAIQAIRTLIDVCFVPLLFDDRKN
jgi:hypothetical protein